MRLGEAVDYSQGLPTPVTTTEGVGDVTATKLFSSIIPIGVGILIVIGISALVTSPQLGLSGLEGKGRRRRKMTGAAEAFVHHEIRKLVGQGKSQKQAIRAAFQMARKSGYKVPPPPK